jgi:hypothetical protein
LNQLFLSIGEKNKHPISTEVIIIGALYQEDAYGMIIVLLQDAENATLPKMHAPYPLEM